MTLKSRSLPQYPQESLSTPSVLGSSVHSGQLPTTTPALPSYWDQLLEWATTRNVTGDLYRLIDPTLLIEQPQAIGSVLSVLATPHAHSMLSNWSIESECALSLLHLSSAIDSASATLPKYSPLPHEKAAAGYFTPVGRYYLLALLVARLPPVSPEEKLWFERLRMWLLVHAMENAEHGIAVAKMSIVATMDILNRPRYTTMKVMTARDAKNHFGEFLDSARREPVVVTRNGRPVGIMISVEDAADTLFSDLFIDKESGYEEWLFGKVSKTKERVATGETGLHEHADAMSLLKGRLAARLPKTA